MAIVETDSPKEIWRILDENVEAVLWRRRASPAVQSAIAEFNEQAFGLDKIDWKKTNKTIVAAGFSAGQLLIRGDDQLQYPELAPLWRSGRTLRSIFEQALATHVFPMQTLIQRPQRKNADRTFHRDLALNSAGNPVNDSRVYFFVPHKLGGTEIIPEDDAGFEDYDMKNSALIYPAPLTLENKIQIFSPDILIAKAGANGTVHRAPYIRDGHRWWSFYSTKNSIATIRRDFGL